MDRPGKQSIDGRPLPRPDDRPAAQTAAAAGAGTPPAWPPFADEPTQQFPVVTPRQAPAFYQPLTLKPKQPAPATPEPAAALRAEPGKTGAKPGMTGAGPGMTGAGPGMTGAGPGMTGAAPGMTGAGPARTGGEPAKVGAEPKVQARAVIIYERRSLGLLVLTAVLVALTAGVVLGQTIADVPRTASAAAQVQPADAGFSTPPSAGPSPSTGPSPSVAPGPSIPPGPPNRAEAGQRVSAPLGQVKAQLLEVGGGAALVTVRSVDLGDRLFEVAALDDSAVPRVVTAKDGPRLEFVRTGAPGRIGAVIQLNSRVKWTLRLAGGAAQQDIDMRAGGLAGIELVGGASRTVLRLPKPKGTVPLSVTGVISELDVHVWPSVPVRVELSKGAGHAVLDGKVRKAPASGTTLTSTGWAATTNRYQLTAPIKLTAIQVDHA